MTERQSTQRRLLDDLVGNGKDAGWYVQAKGLCCPKIDEQLELRRLNDGQFGRLRTFENSGDVDANLTVGVGDVRAIAQQASGRDEFAEAVNCRNGVAGGEADELTAVRDEKWIGRYDKRVGSLLNKACES